MAEVISTTEITWANGANPAAQNLSIPSDAEAVVAFMQTYSSISAVAMTLNGAAPDLSSYNLGSGGSGGYVAIWLSPPTGTQSVDPAWTGGTMASGPRTQFTFVKGISGVRDYEGLGNASSAGTARTFNLTTVAGDLAIGFDSRDDSLPGNPSGWTSEFTSGPYLGSVVYCRVRSIVAAGSTVAVTAQSPNWSAIAGVAFIPAPVITSVTPSTFEDGETGIVIALTGATASGNTVKISPTDDIDDGDAVTQTITAEGTTEITITAVQGALPDSTNLYLFVENDDGASNVSGYVVQFEAGGSVTGTGAITLGAVTVAGSVDLERDAAGAVTLGAVQVAGASTIGREATGAVTLGPVGVSGAGVIGRQAAGAITLGAVEVAGAGEISSETTAAGAITLGPVAVAGAVDLERSAAGAVTLGAVQVAGAVDLTRTAAGDVTLGAVQVSGSVHLTRVAAGAITLGAVQVSGAGEVSGAVNATGAITLGAVQVAGAVVMARDAAGAITLGPVLVAGSATTEGFTVANGNITLGGVQVSASVDLTRVAEGAVTLAAVQVAGSVTVTGEGILAVGDVTLGAVQVAAETIVATPRPPPGFAPMPPLYGPVWQQWDRGGLNLGSSELSSPEGFRAGSAGLVFGRFAYARPGSSIVRNQRPTSGPSIVGMVNLPMMPGTMPSSAIGEAIIAPGAGVTLWGSGDFWVRFAYGAVPGNRVYADADGRPVSGSIAGSVATPWYVVTPCGAGELALISTTTRVQ